jgi:4'-phosphopantetheinyl transferase
VQVRLRVLARHALGRGDGRLSAAEARELAARGYVGRRRSEWISGRAAAHRLLREWLGPDRALPDVLGDPDGAPRLHGGPGASISLSHDGDWIAVALAEGRGVRAGVDLCARAHAGRLVPILTRIGLGEAAAAVGAAGGLDPCVTWAALECTLKLRRLGISALLGATGLAVSLVGGRAPPIRQDQSDALVRVVGLGDPASARVALTPSYALAWGAELVS